MRGPRTVFEFESIRRPAIWACVLSTLSLAMYAVPARGEDPDWRLARRGRELFLRDWRPDDPRCHGGDGLGPVYNATSCVACHGQGGAGGGGPLETNVDLLNLAKFSEITLATDVQPQAQAAGRRDAGGQGRTLGRAEVIERVHPGLRESASVVLHHFGTDPRHRSWKDDLILLRGSTRPPQGSFIKSAGRVPPSFHDGAAFPDAAILNHLSEARLATVTRRNPTPLFGAGLLDAIPDEVLAAAAAESRANSPAAHGRVHRLKGGRVGKFGWKAQVGTLQEFVLTACGNELGLESPGHHQAASPFDPDRAARVPDLTGSECDALVAFVRDLPAPVALDLGPMGSASAREGRRLFESAGCASCHRPDLGDVQGVYSDLLLHDMGSGLSDSGQYYGASDSDSSGAPSSTEWRTPPVWGLRDSAPYLHDGRAATLAEAVELHGGEATQSRARFAKLSIEQQARVEAFLKSLAAPANPSELARRRDAARLEWERDDALAQARVRGKERDRLVRETHDRAEAERRRIDREALRIVGRYRIADQTEQNGNIRAALDLYREIVRLHPGTPSAERARGRIDAIAR